MTITQAVGWALIHFLWQGAAIALALAVLLRFLRARPTAKYGLAVSALFSMPVAAAVTTLVQLDSRSNAGSASTALAARYEADSPVPLDLPPLARADSDAGSSETVLPGSGAAGWRVRLGPMLPWLVAGWLAGVFVLAVRRLVSWRAARRLTRIGVTPPPALWRETLVRLADRMHVRRQVSLMVSAVARVPSVIGWLRPIVLVPVAALSGLAPAQIELLLAHELAHVRRLDYLVNVLQCAVESLLFYHPGVWWVSSVVRKEREHCCDDLAVATQGDAMAYAEALVAMEELRLGPAPAPALAASGGSLLERIRRLVEPGSGEAELFPRWLSGATLAAAILAAVIGTRLVQAEAAPGAVVERLELATPEPGGTGGVGDQEPRGMAPDTVIRHPDPNASLGERFEWARREGGRWRAYWIGYGVDPLWPGPDRSVYVGRSIRLGGRSGGITISGRMVNIGESGKVEMPGVRLLTLVGGRPDDVAITMAFGGRNGGDRLDRVLASTVSLPVDFERRPLIWLGRATDDESIGLLERLRSRNGLSIDARADLVNSLGVHRSTDLVVPRLAEILRSDEPYQIREAAAEWLGWHPDRRSVSALAHAARTDRSADIRREAAESVGDLEIPEAFDTLVALAKTLRDPDARREAVEALSERSEGRAVPVLVDIARNDPSSDIRREAVETLGEFEDHRGLASLKELARTLDDLEARRQAVESLGEAAEGAEAVEVLEAIARQDESEEIQREAVETLGELEGGEGLAVVRELAVEHRSDEVRRQAVETLAEAAPEQAIELLERTLRDDPSEEVRRQAAETLGQVDDPKALAVLIRAAEADDPEVAREAVETLGETEKPEAIRAVARLAQTAKDDEIRREAVETYGENAAPKAAVELFRRLIQRERSEAVQHEILETLAELEGKEGLRALLDIAKTHPDRGVRAEAIRRLADMEDDAAQGELAKIIER